jgi:hypothetical protein
VQAGREALAEDVEERERAEGEQREAPVDEEQDHRDRNDGDGVGDGEGDEHDELLDLLQVGVGPAHEVAGLHAVVVGEVEALEVGEHLISQARLDDAGFAERPVPTQPREGGGQQRRDADGGRPGDERGPVARDDALIDGPLDERRCAHLGDGPQQPDHHADRDADPLGPQRGEHEAPAIAAAAHAVGPRGPVGTR